MPRKSAAALSIVTPKRPRARLAPSADAPEDVAAVFREILTATPADHFVRGDVPLIQAYAEAIVMARRAAVELDRTAPWCRAARAPAGGAGESASRPGEPQRPIAAIATASCRQSLGRAQGEWSDVSASTRSSGCGMPNTEGELPSDIDPEELNAMIRDLATSTISRMGFTGPTWSRATTFLVHLR